MQSLPPRMKTSHPTPPTIAVPHLVLLCSDSRWPVEAERKFLRHPLRLRYGAVMSSGIGSTGMREMELDSTGWGLGGKG